MANSKNSLAMTKQELIFIQENALSMTDEEMAEKLHRGIKTIRKFRRMVGIDKTHRGYVTLDQSKQKPIDKNLTDGERADFFKTLLKNSQYYDTLKEQFTLREINFYLEEWSGLCLQFEDILATEKRQIDEYIKAQILGARTLRNIKIMEEEIIKLTTEIETFRATHNMEDDQEAQERDMQLGDLCRMMSSQSQHMHSEYQKNVELKNKMLADLNGRRTDRIDQISKRGTTFLGLVQAFREKEIRDSQGRHAELVRLAKEKKKKEWAKPILFPDGTKDCVLVDENSEFTQDEAYCWLLDKYRKSPNKHILIVDGKFERFESFKSMFDGATFEYVSNKDKAVEKLDSGQKYDLICLESELGINQIGEDVARHIIDNNLCKETDILVHSINQKNAKDICVILSDKFANKLDVCDYHTLLSLSKIKG